MVCWAVCVLDDNHDLIDETLQTQCLPEVVTLLSSPDKDLQVSLVVPSLLIFGSCLPSPVFFLPPV